MTMTTAQLTARAGITERQINHWLAQGFIPGADQLRYIGSGSQREWTPPQIAFTLRLARLVRAGIKPREAAEALHDQTVDGRLPAVLHLAEGVVVHLASLPVAVAR